MLFKVLLKVWHKPYMKRFILLVASFVPNKTYVRLVAKGKLHYWINLEDPKTFNEKLNWMKLYYHRPEFTQMADKYDVKKLVADRIGEQYVVKNLGCWDSFDEIEFDKLPDKFVLKTTHDSSGAFVCKDKRTFGYQKVRKEMNVWLGVNYFYACREWPYKDVPPRIIADELLEDKNGKNLLDYKFWCFDGKPTFMYCTVKRNKSEIFENFYDMNFNPVAINHGYPRHQPEFEKPDGFAKMKDLAAKLSEGLPFIRVDFFYVDGKVYFGEYTFYDWAGLQPFISRDMDLQLGKLINLSSMK